MRLRPYFTPRRRVTAREIAAILANEKITRFGGTITHEGPLPLPAAEGAALLPLPAGEGAVRENSHTTQVPNQAPPP